MRDLKLTALLSRLVELDPKHAVDVARSGSLETDFVVRLFRLWAARDADAAIRELALFSPQASRREIALAILDVIGNVERVAAALSGRWIRTGFSRCSMTCRLRDSETLDRVAVAQADMKFPFWTGIVGGPNGLGRPVGNWSAWRTRISRSSGRAR